MFGVEILTSQEVAIEYEFNWFTCLIVFIPIFIVAVISGVLIYAFNKNDVTISSALIMSTIIGTFFGIVTGTMCGAADRVPIKYETQYKVTISDEVKMDEFCEKYEIIGQDGKIYMVRERNE